MSRFTLLDKPLVLPMKCAICFSSATDRKYVDLDISFDRYGRIYLCSSCILEVASLINLVPVAELAVAKAAYKSAIRKLAGVVQENEDLRNAVATLRNLDNLGDSVLDSNSVRPVAEFSESAEREGQDDSESFEQATSRESRSVSKDAELFQFS